MLIARTLLTIPGQVAGPLAQMAAAVAFTHWLSPAALGVYAIAWATQELAYYLLVAWWTSFVQRYISSHAEPSARARLDAAELAIHLGGAAAQAIIACVAVALVLGADVTPQFLAALVAFTVTRNLSAHFATRARAQHADAAFTVLQTVGPIGGLGLGVAAAAYVDPSADALLVAYAVAQTLALALGLRLMRFAPSGPSLSSETLRASWAYGAPLILAHLSGWAANHGVRFIVEFGMGIESVGQFTVAWWLGLRIASFASVIVTGATFAIAIDRLNAQGAAAARQQLSDNGALLLALLAPATAGAALVVQPLVSLLVAAPFRDVTTALLPFALAAGALKAFREHGPEQAFLVFGKTRLSLLTSSVEAATTVIGCTIGMMAAGLTGAVIGCFAASLISTLIAVVSAKRAVGYGISASDIGRVIIAVGAMTAVVAALPQPASHIGLVVPIAVGASVYGLVGFALWRWR